MLNSLVGSSYEDMLILSYQMLRKQLKFCFENTKFSHDIQSQGIIYTEVKLGKERKAKAC